MAVAYAGRAGSGGSNASNGSLGLVTTRDIAVGEKLLILVTVGNAVTISSVADNVTSTTNVYSVDASDTTANPRLFLVRCDVTTAIATGKTITATFSGATTARMMTIDGFTGLAAGGLDSTAGVGNGAGTAPTATTGSTTQIGDLILGGFSYLSGSITFTADTAAGFTALATLADGTILKSIAAEWRTTASTGAKVADGTLGSSTTWTALAAAYKAGATTTHVGPFTGKLAMDADILVEWGIGGRQQVGSGLAPSLAPSIGGR